MYEIHIGYLAQPTTSEGEAADELSHQDLGVPILILDKSDTYRIYISYTYLLELRQASQSPAILDGVGVVGIRILYVSDL